MSDHQETDEYDHKTATLTAKSMIRTNIATLIAMICLIGACVTGWCDIHYKLLAHGTSIDSLSVTTSQLRDALIYNHIISGSDSTPPLAAHTNGKYP